MSDEIKINKIKRVFESLNIAISVIPAISAFGGDAAKNKLENDTRKIALSTIQEIIKGDSNEGNL